MKDNRIALGRYEVLKLPERDSYDVKAFVRDVKKINPSPSLAYEIGTKVVYYEWNCCESQLGDDHPVTTHLGAFLNFLQHEYEEMLVRGELRRKADTPNTAFNGFLKGRPKEFLEYTFQRPGDYIRVVLEDTIEAKKEETKEYARIEKHLRKKIKEEPENPGLWNQLRLTLWILGKYGEASDAFKEASKLGWVESSSSIVGI